MDVRESSEGRWFTFKMLSTISLELFAVHFLLPYFATSRTPQLLFAVQQRSGFFDHLRIYIRAGAGGQGQPRYGGLGGKGGDVILQADSKVDLKHLKQANPTKRFVAGLGKNSSKLRLIAEHGEDCVVRVPTGICVKNDAGRTLADLTEDGQRFLAAQGGQGGNHGNSFNGQRGQAYSVVLDLKLIADIGLVGFPNAGKSTFLTTISRASPKIAEYPFTTLRPQIGVMKFDDFRQITVADLPGLIEGAYMNKGLGHSFLKHVERTKLLLFMVDINGFQLGRRFDYRTAFETILLLNKELELYNKDMLEKPAVLALNKIDTDPDKKLTDSIIDMVKNLPDSLSEIDESLHPKTIIKFDDIFTISTMLGQNTEEMKHRLRKLLDIYADMKREKLQSEQKASRHSDRGDLYRDDRPWGREYHKERIA